MSDLESRGPQRSQRVSRRTIRILVALAPALAFMGILWFGLARSGSQAVSGNGAPSFDLALLDGSGNLTDEDLRGEPVVINFWASWCIPCREEAPLLERTWRTYKDDGWTFAGAIAGPRTGDQQGTVILGAISEDELIENVEILLRRMGSR